jgi:hypothetical protein
MLHLFSNWERVERELGCSLREHFLMAVRSFDNPRASTPFILNNGRETKVLLPEVERGNLEMVLFPYDLQVVFVRPYFTFDPDRKDVVYPDLLQAIHDAFDGEQEISVDENLPVGIESQLASHFRVSTDGSTDILDVCVRTVPREWICSRLSSGLEDAKSLSSRLLNHAVNQNEIKRYLEPQPDRRFSLLDDFLRQHGLSSVIVTSRLNMQEIGGVPLMAFPSPVAVVYRQGDQGVSIIERWSGKKGERFSSLRIAMNQLLGQGTAGIEAEDLDVRVYRSSGLSERDTYPADTILRRWRDEIAIQDLPYYIISTRTSLFAMEKALTFAAAKVKGKEQVTELDAYGVYFKGLNEFILSTGFPIRARPLMTNMHSGSRTLYPSNPVCYSLTPSANTLKIDAGCFLENKEGYVMGCSDIARTLAFNDDGKELYRMLREAVRYSLVPCAKTADTGEKVYQTALSFLSDRCKRLSSHRLDPALPSLEEHYDRDVGHLLGKNNLSSLRFIKGDHGKLTEGMIACCEVVWPIKGHCLAYEDTCLVTAKGGLNLTCNGEEECTFHSFE